MAPEQVEQHQNALIVLLKNPLIAAALAVVVGGGGSYLKSNADLAEEAVKVECRVSRLEGESDVRNYPGYVFADRIKDECYRAGREMVLEAMKGEEP